MLNYHIMKKGFLLILSFCLILPVFAKHIIGGEMSYQYVGPGAAPNTLRFKITLKLFRDQNAGPDAAAMPTSVYIGVFDNDTRTEYPGPGRYTEVSKTQESEVTVNPFPSCITSPPSLNYHVAYYTYEMDLPVNISGYTATYQTCCRVTPIQNVFNVNGTGAGSTFSCTIPPEPDSSPVFSTSIDAICGNKPFKLQSFTTTDPDADSVVYYFTGAFDGGSTTAAANVNPSPPPYNTVSYINPYNGTSPLGSLATIDPKTGIISGIAPPVGRYVVNVGVVSYRAGRKLATTAKDFIINVTNCDFAGARLNPKPVQCDSFKVSFSNDDFSPLNKTFYWEFGDPASGVNNTSTSESPIHQYSDTGTYVYKLVVNRGQDCSDSTIQTVKVYPGFVADFSFDGKCVNSQVFFTDKSTTTYGTINSWKWDFGVAGSLSDTSVLKNPSFTYNSVGTYPVALTITSTKGCVKTFTDTVHIIAKPPFSITNDTLICSIDTLRLNATGSGTIVWTPNYNISNINDFHPLVSPKKTTTYYANYSESRGCNNMDSIVVSVVDQVSLKMPSDTTICLTDTLLLKPLSNGLYYKWTPAASLSSDTARSPMAIPMGNTVYNLTVSIGKCNTTGKVSIKAVPYPKADAGRDTIICINQSVQLSASGGSTYEWQPTVFLNNANIPNPVATPAKSIMYYLKVNDALGCPKPSYDSVMVTVEIPFVDAGPRDTSVVVDQPLQLFAQSDAVTFLWTPSTGLNNPAIQNPIALLSNNQEYVVKATSKGGCLATDTIMVKVFKVTPGFYVPNAFTPNGDGLNDILTPIAIGMKSIKFFRIYNRTGKIVFATNEMNKGWDGSFKGVPQDSDTFVWQAEGEDYTGKVLKQKGTVTLIR